MYVKSVVILYPKKILFEQSYWLIEGVYEPGNDLECML